MKQKDNIIKVLLAYKYVVLIVACIICVCVISITIRTCTKEPLPDIILKKTPIEILSIEAKQDLYVCSSVIEDYVVEKKEKDFYRVDIDEYKRVVSVRKKCAYKLELDKVKFLVLDSAKTVYVRMPEVIYEKDTYAEDVTTICNAEGFWDKYSLNPAKEKALKNIDKIFDTEQNRQRATLRAMNIVQYLVLSICGKDYNVAFEIDLESIRDKYKYQEDYHVVR